MPFLPSITPGENPAASSSTWAWKSSPSIGEPGVPGATHGFVSPARPAAAAQGATAKLAEGAMRIKEGLATQLSSDDEGFAGCNDAGFNCFHADTQHSRRLLRLGLQALARALLSRRAAAEALVRALCGGIRHGRDQRQLLSPAARFNLRELAREGAAGLSLCGQGQPLHHPHEEAGRTATRRSTGSSRWRGASSETLGPILYQLPPSLHKDLTRLDAFLSRLPSDLEHVVEFRHKSWYDEEVLELLDRPWRRLRRPRPQGLQVAALGERPHRLCPLPRLGRQILGPLFGRGADRLDRLVACAAREGRSVWCYFNNDIHGHAIEDARTLEVDGRANRSADWQEPANCRKLRPCPTPNRFLITSRQSLCEAALEASRGDRPDDRGEARCRAEGVWRLVEPRSPGPILRPQQLPRRRGHAGSCAARSSAGLVPVAALRQGPHTRMSAPATAATSMSKTP